MKNWSNILGHERPRGVFRRAIDGDRLHHAYLLTGPPGVGKFTTAHALAAVLNCKSRKADEFQPNCGECSPCRRIGDRQHPDVLFVEPPKRVIKISQIREVEKASISAPYEGRYRVVVINDAHTMTEEAANALLKTLEEPPERMILLVVTDQPHRLLDTIISRCQRLRFGALDEATVADALAVEEDDVDDDLLVVAAGFGEGSLGRSLAMLRSGMLADRREFLERLFELDSRSIIDWLDLADELSDSTDELESRLEIITVVMRDILLVKRADPERIINADLRELIESQAPRFSLEAILTTLDALMSAKRRLDHNVNATLLAEDLVDRIRDPDERALYPPA